MIKISEIQPNQGKINVELELISVEPIKEFEKFGKQLKLASALAKDDSGEIKMSFWNADAEKVKAGQKIKITNGYCSEFKGEKQLSTGKFGSMEILE